MESRHLTSVEEVISVLGPKPIKVGRMVGASSQAVYNWRRDKKFPAKTFPRLSKELEKQGYTAALSVWGIEEPTQ